MLFTSVRLKFKIRSDFVLTASLAIYYGPYTVRFKAVGTSSDKLVVCNGCKELLPAVIASYYYIHSEPSSEKRFVRI